MLKDDKKKYPTVYKKTKNKKKKIKKLTARQIKRRKFMFKLFKWTSLSAILIGSIIFIMLSPIFAIKKITINTDGKLTEQEIISLSALMNFAI